MRKVLFVLSIFIAGLTAHSTAQHQLHSGRAMRGEPALELALRKLDTVGTFMMTTAHPDDENNAMLAYFSHGKGFRTTLVTATRGEGGQNEIGPELFESLAVLRTEELLAAHKFDGAEQYFTRAVDFGFSFSVEETLEKWGHQEILGDFVRMIRTIRPDVIVGFVFDGDGGGQHHQTSARLTLEAFRAAADPNQFPEQIKEGLRPWQAKKFYYTAGFGPAGRAARRAARRQLTGEAPKQPLMFEGGGSTIRCSAAPTTRSPREARSMHKCQGMSQLLAAPLAARIGGVRPGRVRAYRLRDTVLAGWRGPRRRRNRSTASTRAWRACDVRRRQPAGGARQRRSPRIDGRSQLLASSWRRAANAATVAPLAAGLTARAQAAARIAGGHGPRRQRPGSRLNSAWRRRSRSSRRRWSLAADVRIDAVADDGLVVAGQPVQRADARRHSRQVVPVEVSMPRTDLNGFSCENSARSRRPDKAGVIPGGREADGGAFQLDAKDAATVHPRSRTCRLACRSGRRRSRPPSPSTSTAWSSA